MLVHLFIHVGSLLHHIVAAGSALLSSDSIVPPIGN
jgi:hypothetical protein